MQEGSGFAYRQSARLVHIFAACRQASRKHCFSQPGSPMGSSAGKETAQLSLRWTAASQSQVRLLSDARSTVLDVVIDSLLLSAAVEHPRVWSWVGVGVGPGLYPHSEPDGRLGLRNVKRQVCLPVRPSSVTYPCHQHGGLFISSFLPL